MAHRGGKQATEGEECCLQSWGRGWPKDSKGKPVTWHQRGQKAVLQEITLHFSGDTESLWKGIQTITNYKPVPQTADSSSSLPNELNKFFAHFEAHNGTIAQKSPPQPEDQVLLLSPDSVRRCLSRINSRKATGPDNIPGRVLRDCAAELRYIHRHLQHISEPGCCPHMPQNTHHHPCAQEVISLMP